MKKLFVVVFVLAASITFAAAQPGGGQRMSPEERAKATTERLTNLLSLKEEQKTKIGAIELDLNKQMEAKRQSIQGDREAMRAAMQEIDKVRDEKYKAVLTADQFKKYLNDKEERRQRGEGPGRRNN